MKILFKYPSRGRPDVFKTLLEKYYEYLSGDIDYEFCISIDADDPTMNNAEMLSYLKSKPKLKFHIGTSKSKIDAINADLTDKLFDILFLVSDDMVPVVQGFDKIIADQMQMHFPNLDGCLHFNDGLVGPKLCTLSIMGKKMYDMFGYIYHPDYVSLFCDNEFHIVTNALNRYVYIDNVIVKHLWAHPEYQDDMRKNSESHYNRDGQVFQKRRLRGFPKESIFKGTN
jgi:hypothetical protein